MNPDTLNSRFLLTGLLLAMLLSAAVFGFRRGYSADPKVAPERVEEAADHCGDGTAWNPMKIYGLPFSYRPKLPSEENMTLPIFPGCEGQSDYEERVFCGFRRLLAFVDDHQYQPPGSAAERVFVKVTIDQYGRMATPEVTQGADLRNRSEALRIVNLLMDRDVRWTPATRGGIPEARAFVFPFTFHGATCSL
ncbi:energy transducer TonB [Neolewinella litorea]|uniref:TonB C-terminal domain-containing protein n=1 Tax=Neolewinella litorea TaxID=2562452 RepID=A0A4S4NLP9_9BACT|nr:hypothetical protein [Neolewinella litorea]THH39248.1 hypothetical protein E4021_10845 [Neolewinella litorea]